MATVSSHVLDAVRGCSAVGMRVVLQRIEEVVSAKSGSSAIAVHKNTEFDVIANDEGRIIETVTINAAASYELVFYASDYFNMQGLGLKGRQIVDQAVVRLSLPDPDERYHIPIILSPHSYSLWWSQ